MGIGEINMSKKNYEKGEIVGVCLFVQELPERIGKGGAKHRRAIFKCPECGNEWEADIPSVSAKQTKACGCVSKKKAARLGKKNITHGHSMPGSKYYKEYRTWQ